MLTVMAGVEGGANFELCGNLRVRTGAKDGKIRRKRKPMRFP